MTDKGRALLIKLEAIRLQAYWDVRGIRTIGCGHALTAGELATERIRIGNELVDWTKGLTEEQAEALLDQDLRPREKMIREFCVKRDLTPNQFDALLIFAFNVGMAAFRSSTLLRKINAGQLDEIPAEFRRWNKAGGKVCQGLVNRREAEITLWESK